MKVEREFTIYSGLEYAAVVWSPSKKKHKMREDTMGYNERDTTREYNERDTMRYNKRTQ